MSEEKHPKVIVGALVYDEKGRIFLAKSSKWKGCWVVPGGHVEWGEKIADALHREIREETGMEVGQAEFLGLQEDVFPPEHQEEKHFIFLDYACPYISGIIELNEEFEEYQWFDPQEALGLELKPSVRSMIERFCGKNA